MAITGGTSATTGLRSLGSSRRREASSSSSSSSGRRVTRDVRIGIGGIVTNEINNMNRQEDYHHRRRRRRRMGGGEAVMCSGRGAINVAASLSSSDATAMTRGVVGGGIAIAATSRASWFRFRRANDASRSLSTPTPRVVPRAGGVAAIADVSGDDAAPTAAEENAGEEVEINHWKNAMPANDAIDKQILKLFVPAMLNFLIIPLVGAVDVFWIGRMGSAVALAAQGAANQVFQSAFWIISFMPSVLAPVVAKAAASGDTEEVQRAVGEAVFVASFVGLCGMALLTCKGCYLFMYFFLNP